MTRSTVVTLALFAALLAMAVFEVWGRSLVLAARRNQVERAVPAVELA